MSLKNLVLKIYRVHNQFSKMHFLIMKMVIKINLKIKFKYRMNPIYWLIKNVSHWLIKIRYIMILYLIKLINRGNKALYFKITKTKWIIKNRAVFKVLILWVQWYRIGFKLFYYSTFKLPNFNLFGIHI